MSWHRQNHWYLFSPNLQVIYCIFRGNLEQRMLKHKDLPKWAHLILVIFINPEENNQKNFVFAGVSEGWFWLLYRHDACASQLCNSGHTCFLVQWELCIGHVQHVQSCKCLIALLLNKYSSCWLLWSCL
jgi:hypothetical protein